MSTATTTDFAFDYARGTDTKAAATPPNAFSRWFKAYVARREAAAMDRIMMIDPRLGSEIQAAKDRAEW